MDLNSRLAVMVSLFFLFIKLNNDKLIVITSGYSIKKIKKLVKVVVYHG